MRNMAFTVEIVSSTGEMSGGGETVYIYQFLQVAACRWLFRAVLKDGRDLHSFKSFGRAFHILVA